MCCPAGYPSNNPSVCKHSSLRSPSMEDTLDPHLVKLVLHHAHYLQDTSWCQPTQTCDMVPYPEAGKETAHWLKPKSCLLLWLRVRMKNPAPEISLTTPRGIYHEAHIALLDKLLRAITLGRLRLHETHRLLLLRYAAATLPRLWELTFLYTSLPATVLLSSHVFSQFCIFSLLLGFDVKLHHATWQWGRNLRK